MDFEGMKRKELQAFCKKHGIPANLSNREMASRLSSLLMDNKEEEKTLSTDSEIDSVIVTKIVKKVRFSPENETFIFEGSDVESESDYELKTKRTRKRKSTVGKNATKKKKVEEENPVRVLRSRAQSSSVVVVEEDSEKRVRRGKENVDESRRESIRVQLRSRKESGTFGDNNLEKRAKPKKVAENSKRNLKKKEKSSALSEDLGKIGYCSSRITRARTRANGNDSAVDNDSQRGAVIEIQEECPSVVLQLEETSKGLGKKVRMVSELVAGEYIENEEVLMGSRKRLKNMELEEVSEIKPNVDAMKQSLHDDPSRRTRRNTRLFSLDGQLTTHETDGRMSPVREAPVCVAKPTRRSARNTTRQVSIETSDNVSEIAEGIGKYMRTKVRKGPVLNERSSVVAHGPVNEKPARQSKRNISKRKMVELLKLTSRKGEKETCQESSDAEVGFAVPEALASETDPALYSNKEITEKSAVTNQFDTVPDSAVDEEVTDDVLNLYSDIDITVEEEKGSMVEEDGESSLGKNIKTSLNLLPTNGDSGYGKSDEATGCPNKITNVGPISSDNGFQANSEGECSEPLDVNDRLEIGGSMMGKSINLQNDKLDGQSVEGEKDTDVQEDHRYLVEFDPIGNAEPVQDHISEVSEGQEPVKDAENWSQDAEILCTDVPHDVTKESNTAPQLQSTFVPEIQDGIEVSDRTIFKREISFHEEQSNSGKTEEPGTPELPSIVQEVVHGGSEEKLQFGGSVLRVFNKNDRQVDDKPNQEDSEDCFDNVPYETNDEKAEQTSVTMYLDQAIEKHALNEGEPGSLPYFTVEKVQEEKDCDAQEASNERGSTACEVTKESSNEVRQTVLQIENAKKLDEENHPEIQLYVDRSFESPETSSRIGLVKSESWEPVKNAESSSQEAEKLDVVVPLDVEKETFEEGHYGEVASSNTAVLLPSTFEPESQDEKAEEKSLSMCSNHEVEKDAFKEDCEPGSLLHFTSEKLQDEHVGHYPNASNEMGSAAYEVPQTVQQIEQPKFGKLERHEDFSFYLTRSTSFAANDANIEDSIGRMDNGIDAKGSSKTANCDVVTSEVARGNLDYYLVEGGEDNTKDGDRRVTVNHAHENVEVLEAEDETDATCSDENVDHSNINNANKLDEENHPENKLYVDLSCGSPEASSRIGFELNVSPSLDERVSELHVCSAEFTTLSLGNGQEDNVKKSHELSEETSSESKHGEKDKEVEGNLVMTEKTDVISEGQLGECEHHTVPAVSEEIITGDGGSSNEQDDASAIIQEYMEREAHADEFFKIKDSFASENDEGRMTGAAETEGYKCDATVEPGIDNVLSNSGKEEDKEARASSERTEMEEENDGPLLPLGGVATERVLLEHTIKVPKNYHTALDDVSVALSVNHEIEDPMMLTETVETVMHHDEVKFADPDSNIEVSGDLDRNASNASNNSLFRGARTTGSKKSIARMVGDSNSQVIMFKAETELDADEVPDNSDISDNTKLANIHENEIVSTEKEADDEFMSSGICSSNVEDGTQLVCEPLISPCKFADDGKWEEKSSIDIKLLADTPTGKTLTGMESECNAERDSVTKSKGIEMVTAERGMESECNAERDSVTKSKGIEMVTAERGIVSTAMDSPIQGNNELGTDQTGSGQRRNKSKEACWTEDVDHLDLNNVFSSNWRNSSKITPKQIGEPHLHNPENVELSSAASKDTEKDVQRSAVSSVTASSRDEKNTLEIIDDFSLFTGFELNLFSEDGKQEELEKLLERKLEDNVMSETSEDMKKEDDPVVTIAEVSAEQCSHLENEMGSNVKNKFPVAFEDGCQEKGWEANLLESISGSANLTRKSNSKYLVPVTENVDVSFGASKDTADFGEVLLELHPEKGVQCSDVSSVIASPRDCMRLNFKEEKNTLESCDDFPLITGLELNLFSEERKIEEIEKLHEKNLEDQVISETSEDSKQAEVHVNSGVEAVAFGDGHQEKCNLLESMSGSANPPTRKSNTTFMVPLTPRSVQKLNAMKENIGTTKRDLVHSITAPHRSKRRPLGDLQKN